MLGLVKIFQVNTHDLFRMFQSLYSLYKSFLKVIVINFRVVCKTPDIYRQGGCPQDIPDTGRRVYRRLTGWVSVGNRPLRRGPCTQIDPFTNERKRSLTKMYTTLG